jgi:sulfoxide reductase catalytic subunit YedY
MLIKRSPDIRYSEITPKHLYLNRRSFLAGLPLAGAALVAATARAENQLNGISKSPFSTTERVTPYNDVTHYNNYYEFGTRKDQPASLAQKLKTSPWTVKVEGAVNRPQVFDIDAIMKLAPLEERIYRHRCVEAWSIVVPWVGFPLNMLIKKVEPTEKAKFVAFQTVLDRGVMLSEGEAGIPLPYVEGLRLDEGMHPLAILCVGMYGEALPKQDGAPVRLVVPVEIWLQKHQIDCDDQVCRKAAAHYVEHHQRPRVWVLLECKSRGRSSALEPGLGTPAG